MYTNMYEIMFNSSFFFLFGSTNIAKMKGPVLWAMAFLGVLLMSGVECNEDDIAGYTKCSTECGATLAKGAYPSVCLFSQEAGGNQSEMACMWPCMEKFLKKTLGNSPLTLKVIPYI